MVLPSPDGATPDQRSVNRDTLNGYVLEVGGVRTPVKDGLIRLVVPQGAHGLEIALRDRGRTLSRTRVLVGPTALATGPIVPPNYGQAGRAFPVKGQFDGDLQNTQAAIGSQPAMVVAESPRQTVLVAPREPVGATTVAIREGQQRAEGAYRNIGVILTSPKTTLLRGEQTQVNVQVVGLAGISAPVRLRLEATGTVQLQGGNTQLIAIAPSRVDPSGRFTLDLNLRASAAGPFAVTAAVGESPAP